ncbi:MAG TPA: hypothetical protein PKU78_04945 [Candidatus Dojkabacteria bacterium]|nr:hypothetical protein [Candidatus Dojkabacteria bacterium]HRO65541.1 hypothetical protein [Candidatus Dojkabacteria bacterium]HRP37525.1 hypothetical protein [Candidatus Dojkabacteria bacterium]HRP51624.1 hypothetical protein [Candidatus Dojkabacteria bacterium]
MAKIKSILRTSYKKNITLLKWIFSIVVILGIVVVPILSAVLSI